MTQPDSIVPEPGNPQDWNRYSYARNNPIKYVDPSGHAVECSGGVGSCVVSKTSPGLNRKKIDRESHDSPNHNSTSISMHKVYPPYRNTPTATTNPTLSVILTASPTAYTFIGPVPTSTPTPYTFLGPAPTSTPTPTPTSTYTPRPTVDIVDALVGPAPLYPGDPSVGMAIESLGQALPAFGIPAQLPPGSGQVIDGVLLTTYGLRDGIRNQAPYHPTSYPTGTASLTVTASPTPSPMPTGTSPFITPTYPVSTWTLTPTYWPTP